MISWTAQAAAPAETSPWHGRVYRVQDQRLVDFAELVSDASRSGTVIMGEKHYTNEVQAAEARIIESVVEATQNQGRFTTAWEFLNASMQAMTRALFQKFVNGQITAHDFLEKTQGGGDVDAYAPVLEVTKKLGGDLIGVNLSRAEKSPVVKGGIQAADPKLVPPGFEMGTSGYRERFFEVMGEGGHATPAQIENYYAAQCLTDDVMAFNLRNGSQQPLRFLVVGSFHTDYFDGTVGRYKVRAPSERTTTIRIIDATDFTADALLGQLRDAKYGDVADYVYFVNEPSTEALNQRFSQL